MEAPKYPGLSIIRVFLSIKSLERRNLYVVVVIIHITALIVRATLPQCSQCIILRLPKAS